MGVLLHQALMSLCFNTVWKYAVFWKLTHLEQMMMLTWEDAYYEHQENKPFSNSAGNLLNASHDALACAVAKLPYLVYSLGKGIVGEVAVSGKHLWISTDKWGKSNLSSSFEYGDGMEAQLSAGVKTIVVVAVAPLGVVQLGSLEDVPEDLMMVKHIRDVFSGVYNASDKITDIPHIPISSAVVVPNAKDSENSSFQNTPLSYFAGYELYEALGPAFQMGSLWETEKSKTGMVVEIPEVTGDSSLLMSDSTTDHLLEAMIAKSSFSKSVESSASSRPIRTNKRRAKPGESCRPRPRDRQLIQDRIKELRELVPKGSKCSIDSLLERTIEHVLYMQSVTKHAEKLNKCTASNEEQGTSWAVEVGSNLKVCPIIVENMNTNGQMLVEMLLRECSQFFEIAETIRSLGLTILKAVAEAYGQKTLMRFVVEGQDCQSVHRMDILWSLMQILPPEISV